MEHSLLLDDEDYVVISDLDVKSSTSPENHCPDYLAYISDYIDSISAKLRPLNLKIHDNPELAYDEYFAHWTLTKFMKSKPGWKVTPSAYGIPTAFIAVFDSGRKGPTVSFNAEYDALKSIGHSCGHNLIMTASVAGALAVAAAIEQHQLPGKVVLFGTPAEEGGGGKIKLLNAGAYSDHNVDVSLITHPGSVPDSALMRTAAYEDFKVEYFGREAHAAANPWEGINALDAMVTAYNAISVLRQQTMPGDIIQGHITDGGIRPNIIHAYTAGVWVVRASTKTRLAELKQKVEACFQSGALATGAKLKMTPIGSYDNHVPNFAMGRFYRHYFNRLGGEILTPDLDYIQGQTQASTDQGNISYAVPSLNVGFRIPSDVGPHNPGFAKAARTEEAHGLALRAAKALAATGIEVLTRKGLLEEIKEEFGKIEKA